MTNERHAILNSRIPTENGRAITSTERASLTDLGMTVPGRTRVYQAFGSDYIGALYGATNGALGGLHDLGISVTVQGDA